MKTAVDKLHAAGLKAGMHTLTGCISTADRWVTPVPDRRLAADASYTLSAPLDDAETAVLVQEQPDELDTVWGYGSRGNVIRVDDELIQFCGLSRQPPYRFTDCKRGAFGTKVSPHKRGAAVDHLLVRWGFFHPDEDSTLMDDIAAAIARVFNTCGFDMIYMDGVTEEIEYLCCKALGHDSALSFQNIQVGGRSENARQDEYLATVGRYERLRLANYFPELVKARLRRPGEEFRLVESPDGDWRFVPTNYALHKVTGLPSGGGTWTVRNRFAAQPVKLRIEALYSVEPCDSDDNLVLAEFAEQDEFTDRACAEGVRCELSPSRDEIKVGGVSGRYGATNSTGSRRGAWSRCGKSFGPEVDIDRYDALGVRVRGDGKGELLNVQLTNSPQHNLAYDEHYVKVDFEGWRYFELLLRERDADKYDQYVWPYGGHSAVYRTGLSRRHVDRLNLYFNDLPPRESVTCCLSPIRALRTTKVTLRNPAVEIGGRRIAFPAALESGDYVEFESQSDCRLYNEQGALVGPIRPEGQIPILAAGENEVRFACQGPKGYNARASVTVVSQGAPFGGKR
jgi:hypothetical protein